MSGGVKNYKKYIACSFWRHLFIPKRLGLIFEMDLVCTRAQVSHCNFVPQLEYGMEWNGMEVEI